MCVNHTSGQQIMNEKWHRFLLFFSSFFFPLLKHVLSSPAWLEVVRAVGAVFFLGRMGEPVRPDADMPNTECCILFSCQL